MQVHSTRLAKTSYTLENLTGLAARCDWFVHRDSVLKRRSPPQTVFISAWAGQVAVPFFVEQLLPTLSEPVRVVVASEDHTFPFGIGDVRKHLYANCQPQIERMLASTTVERVFVENLDCAHSKLFPLPLGVLPYNSCVLKYTALLNGTRTPPKLEDRSVHVFCCHRVRAGPQWEKRANVSRFSKNEWSRFVKYADDIANEDEYMRELENCVFCLCVAGGGYDPSPRCWQALLCGAIPILEHSPLDRAYETLPVVFVNNWKADTLTVDKLVAWKQSLSRYFSDPVLRAGVLRTLSLDYWHNLISSPQPTYGVPIAAVPQALTRARELGITFRYGSAIVEQNVTSLAAHHFLSGDRIVIPRTVWFNNLFGDVHFGHQKCLRILFSDSTAVCLPEKRQKDYDVRF